MKLISVAAGAILLAACVPTEPQPVTVTFCAGQVLGGKLAVRNDGGVLGTQGRWEIIESADGKAFTIPPYHRLSVAFTVNELLSDDLRMFQLTTGELTKLNCIPGTTSFPARSATGTIAGVTTGRSAQVTFGTGVVTRGNGAFTINNAITGGSDLVAVLRVGASTAEKFIVRRNLDLPTGSALDPIDFTSAEAGNPRVFSAAVAGAGNVSIGSEFRLITKNTNAAIPVSIVNGVMSIATLPAAMQAVSDYYVLGAGVATPVGSFFETRLVYTRFAEPANQSMVLGPVLASPSAGFRQSTGPTTVRVTLPVQSEYAERADISVLQSANDDYRSVTMTMTGAYRGHASSWTFETPNPGLLDWRAARMNPAAPTSWTAYASSGDHFSLYLPAAAANFTIREAYRDGALELVSSPLESTAARHHPQENRCSCSVHLCCASPWSQSRALALRPRLTR